jgi:hypothetical protein
LLARALFFQFDALLFGLALGVVHILPLPGEDFPGLRPCAKGFPERILRF